MSATLEPITHVRGRAVVVPGDDVDTDRIVPARFLRCVTFDDLGETLFWDVRHDDDGHKVGHPLDDPKHAGSSIMISGRNFGCGSSREHAPQAIVRAGFRAVIAESFAEIFFGNSTTLGLVCLALPAAELREVRAHVVARPEVELDIDVDAATVRVGEASYAGTIPEAARTALVRGRYDPLSELLASGDRIDAVAHGLGYAGSLA
jgi:3-isopropylmalate/(R)-2-methylmalate dehydratase small subunit